MSVSSTAPAQSKGKTKVTKSAVVAFLRLLSAVNAGNSVLLLTEDDAHAPCAVQEYNDELQSSPCNKLDQSQKDYAKFLDGLASRFDQRDGKGGSQPAMPAMYSEASLKQASVILVGVLKSGAAAGLF
jgi:hypothetical protein